MPLEGQARRIDENSRTYARAPRGFCIRLVETGTYSASPARLADFSIRETPSALRHKDLRTSFPTARSATVPHESIDCKSTTKYLGREIEVNCQALEALQTEWDELTLKEALTSDEVGPYVRQVLTDEITKLGLREAQVQILGDVDEINTYKHQMKNVSFGFNKIASAALFSGNVW